ncbi:Golgi to ER traffic protein 4 homolog isoform X1 [Amborella trichopoda]|uniref:Golgi to ER traffic protein 4 homolog isoform X1 n=1 Tax=Amborella trichopoda TaxID=13333 RepID=UPI0005D32FF1|nr:Golgi to ER traffic protein 4 homolog isoform X1 [Amborella trichopoda]XP_011628932.1 Golgi to ER traffic protein 4 homolog isoform X1 [Amborella trichopoda]|eukprot:XP_011628931.1 Golgi to ER traffic protein 4 homolog isoform X1 [Amborella trichopoda]
MRRITGITSKTLEKLEKSVQAGNYYEAQQLYKTIYARYVASQKYAEALDLLQSGACIQLAHGQVTCGAELAVLFVEVLVRGKCPYNEGTLDRVRKIYQEFPQLSVPQHLGDDDDMQKLSEALAAAKTRVEGCSSFLKEAIKWSAEFGAPSKGSPELHDMLAEYIYSQSPELDITKVSMHFVRGRHPEIFASTLVNFMGKCYPGEDDLAIVRSVLMYLSLGNLRDANLLIDELRKQLASKQLDFPLTDLTQFVIYLLQTLERDALPLFRILRQNYRTSISRDPSFEELLDDIAERFYGVRRRSGGLHGMLGDFFKMMGGEVAA